MIAFKKRLSEAIKSVFSELDSMSHKEFKSEINNFLYDERTSALLYAWDSVNVEEYSPIDSCFEWKELMSEFTTSVAYRKNIPLFFHDDLQREIFKEDLDYSHGLSSDDYFLFKAAA